MTPIQQLMLGVGIKQKTYIDDVFSTYLWAGSGSARSINNGINLSSKGGMVWIKNRTWGTNKHVINDTVRGHSNAIMASETDVNFNNNGLLNGFNSNGFDVNTDNFVNGSSQNYASWTFRKAKGFFDVVTWDGNDTAGRVISHSLGSVPGLIMIKSTTHATSWFTYHRDVGAEKYLILNEGNAVADQTWFMNDTAPTSTGFSVGSSSNVNGSGRSYVAYVFAGGESTAATARSVDFDGSDYISQPGHADFYDIQAQALTLEYWMKADAFSSTQNGGPGVIGVAEPNTNTEVWGFGTLSTGEVVFRYYNGSSVIESTGVTLTKGQWYHLALVHDGSNGFKVFINGTLKKSGTISGSITQQAPFSIGRVSNGQFDGKISNVRVVHAAVYTSSFRPPTEPLTNITNTKLLCCNDSSVTGSTVTTGTITSSDSPTASTDSPFDDPAGFVFGENEDQGIIKCGSYVGNGGTQDIELGFEPQWFFVKKSSDTSAWHMVDCMRGCVTGGNDAWFEFDTSDAESTNNFFKVTPTGFSFEATAGSLNGNGGDFIYMAIRRPDGYVGKSAEAGTDVFNIIAGGSGSTGGAGGCFTSNFPVDFGTIRTTGSHPWQTGARLMGTNYMPGLEQNNAQADANNFSWDSNIGYVNGNFGGYYSWVWRRHAGFDVVTHEGDGVAGRAIPHSLSKTPEMMWVKCRDSSGNWRVYHKGLNGGTNPEQYRLFVNTDAEEAALSTIWNDTAPTSTHFTLGTHSDVNGDGNDYIAILFASVDGISKVGSYTGNGSTSGPSVTTGFSPRFLVVKNASSSAYWVVFDTLRGINNSGNDSRLKLNNTDAANSFNDWLSVSSTGFTLNIADSAVNTNTDKYIYYAHA